jgi:soluble lytic murein transglycosylase-like protein
LSIRLAVALLLALAAPPLSAQHRPSDRYDPTFRKYSKRYFGPGWDWRYFKAQAMAESDLNPAAKSWVGARGLMQLMPTTFQAIQSKRPELASIDDPEWNIAAGIMHDRYLWRLWKNHGSDEERRACMFASYNAGEGTLARAHNAARTEQLDDMTWTSIERIAPKVQRWRYRETLGYVGRIQANYLRLRNAEKTKRK